MEWVQAQLEQMKAEIAAFLHEHLALTLSTEKTQITHIDQGFTFPLHVARERKPLDAKQNVFALPSQANLPKYRAKVKQIASAQMRKRQTSPRSFGNTTVSPGDGPCTSALAIAKRSSHGSPIITGGRFTVRCANATASGRRRGCLNTTPTGFPLQRGPERLRDSGRRRAGDDVPSRWSASAAFTACATPNPQPVSDRVVTTLETPPQLYPAWNGEETRPGQSRFARIVRQRDKVCQRCGKARAEEAHHLQRWSQHLTMDPACGVGLCKRCHIASHHDEQRRAGYSETGMPSSEGGAGKRAS